MRSCHNIIVVATGTVIIRQQNPFLESEKDLHLYIWQSLLAGWKYYSFQSLLAMITFDMTEVS